jgi:hypothetical protein
MPLAFVTVPLSWLCRPSPVLEDELSFYFSSNSCRFSRKVPLLCQFAVYSQCGIGLDLHALPSKRSSISAFNVHNTSHRGHHTGKLLLLLRSRGPNSVLRCLIGFIYIGRNAPCKADSVYKHLHYTVSLQPVHLSILPSAWNNSAPTGRIFMKFDM